MASEWPTLRLSAYHGRMTLILACLLACTDPTTGAAETAETGLDAATSGSLEVLTYNVKGLPDLLTGTDGLSRMEQIAPDLPPFDVIGVQESFDAAFHEALIAETDHPIRDWSGETVDEDRAYGNGLGLLIRGFEEVERTSFFYDGCHGVLDGASDCLASKGLQRVRVRVAGTSSYLDVYNTHHEAGGGPDDVAVRASQVEEVVAAMEAWSGDAAILFMGDMNLHADDAEDVPLLDRYGSIGLRDACTEVGCPETFHIDRVWLRDGPELQLVATAWERHEEFVDADGEDLSDHPAIGVRIDWAR